MPKIISLLVILLLFNVACVSNTSEDCATTTGATFSTSGGQIQNIISTKCSGSTCHSSGGSGTVIWTIGNYNQIKPSFQIMSEAVANGTMPEAGSAPLTIDELIKFECWSQSGYPE